jgi:surface-anchored protein
MTSIRISSVLASAVSLAVLGSAGSAHATNIFKEHLDVDIDYQSGALSLDFKTYTNMSPGVPLNNDDYSPAGNPVIVPLANSYVIPSGSQWACLGSSGSTVYRLKQSFVSNEAWLGWNTQDVPNGTFVNNKVQLEVVQVVSAPAGARFVLYTTNSFGTPTYLLNTVSGGCNDQSMDVSTNAHLHGFWAFSAPGSYTVRFRAKGTLNGGAVTTSPNVDYQFIVQ